MRANFGQIERVARRAADARGPETARELDALQRTHATGGNDKRLAMRERLVRAPEADVRTERKRHQHAVVGCDARGIEHVLPAFADPAPIVRRVEHHQWTAAGARRLMKPDVAIDIPSQVLNGIAMTRCADQFFFEREGPVGKFVQRFYRRANARQLVRVKQVRRQNLIEQRIQPA